MCSFSHSLSFCQSSSLAPLRTDVRFHQHFRRPPEERTHFKQTIRCHQQKKGLKKEGMNLIQKVPALQNEEEVEGGRWCYHTLCKVQSALLRGSGKLVAGLYGGRSDINITSYVPEVWSKLAQAHRCVCMFSQYCRDELPRRLQHPTQSSCCTQTTIQSQ